MEQPLISVIVPVYNVEPWLDQCLRSIVEQTYQNLQIIIIDDASEDGSLDACRNWARKDKRITLLAHSRNAGLSAARNTGLDRAEGEFIGFVDPDDFIEREMYSCLYDAISQKGSDLAACMFTVSREGRDVPLIHHYAGDGTIAVLPASTFAERALYASNGITWSTWNKLYARHLFDGARFPAGMVFEDMAIFPEIACQCTTATVVNEYFYHHQLRPGSITSRMDASKLADWFSAQLQLIDFIASEDVVSKDYLRHYAPSIARSAWMQLQTADIPLREKRACQSLFRTFLRNHSFLLRGLGMRQRFTAAIIAYAPQTFAGLTFNSYRKLRSLLQR